MGVVNAGRLGVMALLCDLFGLGGASALRPDCIIGNGNGTRIAVYVLGNPALYIVDAP